MELTLLADIAGDGDAEASGVLLKLNGELFHLGQSVDVDRLHRECRKLGDRQRTWRTDDEARTALKYVYNIAQSIGTLYDAESIKRKSSSLDSKFYIGFFI